MAHFIPTKTTATAEDTARLFLDNVFRLHGLPEEIVSDRDSKFTGNFWQALFEALGTRLGMSTAFHPQTDGQIERMNRIIEDMRRRLHYVGPDHDDWEELLSSCEFAVYNAYQDSIKTTPFLLNYGQNPRVAAQPFSKVRNFPPLKT